MGHSLLITIHRLVYHTMNKLTCMLKHWVELKMSSTSCLLLTVLLILPRSGQNLVMISGGSHCTPIGQTGTVAEANSTLVINCISNLANLLHWNIPSYDVSVNFV